MKEVESYMYKKHGVFKSPEKDDKIWRYVDFTKFVSLLKKEALYFSRVDKLDDPFEGRYPKAIIENISEISETANIEEEILKALLGIDDYGLIRKMREWTVINCWHINDNESAAMWDLYLKSNDGIAIQTTFDRLCNSFNNCKEKIYIGKVKYLDYDKEFMPIGNIFSPYIYKRKCFEHEKELRALYTEMPIRGNKFDIDKCLFDTGKYISVDLNILIEKIYVSPIAQKWFKELVEAIIKKYNLDKQVIQSNLYKY